MIVAGVLRDLEPDLVTGVVAHFAPAEAPVVDGHLGRPVGTVARVLGEGRNVWFVAEIDDPAIAHRLARGPVAVSIEAEGLGVRTRIDEPGLALPTLAPATSYRGTRGRLGWVLLAVAVMRDGDASARPGSVLWAVAA